MQAALAPRGDWRAYLTHSVGSGLNDNRLRNCRRTVSSRR